MEEKTELEKKAVVLVTEQIIAMLNNNILCDCGTESFEGWCEDGDVFYDNEDITEEEADAAAKLMKKVAPIVDKLTYKHINFGY